MDNRFYSTLENIAILRESGRYTVELRKLSYDGRPGIYYDIRRWEHSPDGTERMLKGISLNGQEWQQLQQAILDSNKQDKEGT